MSINGTDRAERLGKVLVFALAVAGGVLGAVPAVLLLASPRWLAIYAAIGAVVAIVALRGLKATGADLPSLGEIALAAVAGVGPAASMSLVVIGWYWGVYGLVRLGAALAGLVGWQWSPPAAAVAQVVALGLAIPLAPMVVWLAAGSLWRQLFPPAAGVRSPYHLLPIRRPAQLAIGAAGAVAGLVVLLLFIGPDARLFYLWLALYLAFVASPLWAVGEEGSRPHETKPVERAVLKLLKALGFVVVSQPRTGRPEVDPFLLKADFFALKVDILPPRSRALLIAVKVRGGDQEPVEWTQASGLISAAWALNQAKSEVGLSVDQVEAALLLVGRGPGDSLQAFATKEPIHLVHVREADELTRALQTDDPAELGKLARATLGSLDQQLSTNRVPLPSPG